MRSVLEFAYAQARIQARYAVLPTETEWQRLAGTRVLGAYLEDARGGPLRPWIKGFSALSGPHDLELGLRSLAWEQVQEVSTWAPQSWGPAIRWVAWLPFLGVFERLASAQGLPTWAREDQRLQALLDDDGIPSPLALKRQGLAEIAAPGDPQQVADRWIQEWRGRWPVSRRTQRRPLETFCQELEDHLWAFRRADPDTAWALRRRLRDHLALRLHQRPLQPLTAFLYLALILLDLERLRGDLLRRCVFPATQGVAP